jgi:hypothetical protein
LQVGQDGKDPAVPAVGGRQPELGEDVADVLVDRAFGDDQCGGDGRVVVALGHQGEDLVLTGGQGVQRRAAAGEELGHHLRVERGPAGRDPVQRVQELLHPAHPVLEQVADPARAAAEEFGRVGRLDVLGEHEDRQPGDLPAGRERGAQALVAEARRHPDVQHGDVGAMRFQGREDLRPSARDGHHLVPGGGEQQDQPFAQ